MSSRPGTRALIICSVIIVAVATGRGVWRDVSRVAPPSTGLAVGLGGAPEMRGTAGPTAVQEGEGAMLPPRVQPRDPPPLRPPGEPQPGTVRPRAAPKPAARGSNVPETRSSPGRPSTPAPRAAQRPSEPAPGPRVSSRPLLSPEPAPPGRLDPGAPAAQQGSALAGEGGASPGSSAREGGGPAAQSAGSGEDGSGGTVGDASPATSATGMPGASEPRIAPPRVIRAGTEYPLDAFRLTVRRQDLGTTLAVEGAEGTVGMRALIGADGTVSRVEVTASSGSPALDRAAVDAVRRWVFAPATKDGTPIDAYVTFAIRYVVR